MKLVFKDSIFDILNKRIYDAKRANKKIDYILVTEEEYADMRADRDYMHCMDYRVNYNPCAEINLGSMDATFRTIRLEEPSRGRPGSRPYVNFASHLKFQGYDIYVVPARFM